MDASNAWTVASYSKPTGSHIQWRASSSPELDHMVEHSSKRTKMSTFAELNNTHSLKSLAEAPRTLTTL